MSVPPHPPPSCVQRANVALALAEARVEYDSTLTNEVRPELQS